MSYVIQITKEKLPKAFLAALTKVSKLKRGGNPSVNFIALVNNLTQKYPCASVIDDSVWSDGPLVNNAGEFILTLGIIYPKVKEVLPFIISQTQSLGMSVLDCQVGKVYLPLKLPPKPDMGDSKAVIKYINALIKINQASEIKDVINNPEVLHLVDRSNNSYLHFCAEFGQVETFELLHKAGLDINAFNKTKETPLHIAAEAENYEIAKYCIEKKCNINTKNKYHTSPLFSAISHAKSLEIVKLLGDNGADINQVNEYGGTLLVPAVQYGRSVPIVEYLLSKGLDINRSDETGWHETPLRASCSSGMTRFLLENGAEVNSKDTYGRSPLVNFCEQMKYDSASVLLQFGANIKDLKKVSAIRFIEYLYNEIGKYLGKTIKEFAEGYGIDWEEYQKPDVQIKVEDKANQYFRKKYEELGSDNLVFELNPVGNFDIEKLESIRESITQYRYLKGLILRNLHKITALDDFLGNFNELQSLKIIFCRQLSNIPDFIGRLSSLKYLEINTYGIKCISEEIGQLKNLETLIIETSSLEFIPKSISNLSNLKELVITDAKISLIPDLSHLKELKKLVLAELQLTEIPDFVFKLPNLEELNIEGNRISQIPRSILDLKLKKIIYHRNPLVYPPRKELKGGGLNVLTNWFKNN